ncbi:MAG: sulfotransferase [Gemmatimonadota bacterium]
MSSRFRRFLRRTLRPAVTRFEMAAAAVFFRLNPLARQAHTPQFLGIGGQKCGTTWLDKMLRFHPQLGLPRRKEVHFFDGNYWRGLDWYRFHFRGLTGKILGEVTPAYSILPVERIREVHALNPAMRLVLILRNPVERAWSQSEMALARNRRRAVADVPEAEFLRHLESESVLSRSRYSAILRNWLAVFPEEQLHIEFFESIAIEPKPLLTRVLTHIGADSALMPWDQVPLKERLNANPGQGIPEKYRARLRELLSGEMVTLREMLPRPEVLSWKA